MSTQQKALNVYRGALRATRIAFDNDLKTLAAARAQIRQEMRATESKTHPKLNVTQRIDLLQQVSEFLKHNIVQGVKNQADAESRYTLNIHKETELGDNDDISKKKSTLAAGEAVGGGCCGGGNVELKERK